MLPVALLCLTGLDGLGPGDRRGDSHDDAVGVSDIGDHLTPGSAVRLDQGSGTRRDRAGEATGDVIGNEGELEPAGIELGAIARLVTERAGDCGSPE